jgi:malonyl-CoA O-methyltransferase
MIDPARPSVPDANRYALDRHAWRRRRDASAATWDTAAVLSHEVGRRMRERLALVRLPEGPVLDVGAATGRESRALAQALPGRLVVACDPSLAMLGVARRQVPALRRWLPGVLGGGPAPVAAWPDRLPFRPASMALVWSTLLAQWFDPPTDLFDAARLALRNGGLFMFASLGPDTLREVRAAAAGTLGGLRVHRFPDMHDVGDALVQAGFADPVMDVETLTLTWTDLASALVDLRGSGAAGALAGRPRGLVTPRRWRAFEAAWPVVDGRRSATFEVVFGHAWKPEGGPRRTRDGLDIVRVQPRSGRR